MPLIFAMPLYAIIFMPPLFRFHACRRFLHFFLYAYFLFFFFFRFSIWLLMLCQQCWAPRPATPCGDACHGVIRDAYVLRCRAPPRRDTARHAFFVYATPPPYATPRCRAMASPAHAMFSAFDAACFDAAKSALQLYGDAFCRYWCCYYADVCWVFSPLLRCHYYLPIFALSMLDTAWWCFDYYCFAAIAIRHADAYFCWWWYAMLMPRLLRDAWW